MKKISQFFALVLAGVFVLMHSCTYEHINSSDTTGGEDDGSICFERDVLPIFISNCTQSGCHNSISREDGYDLSSYSTIVAKGIKPGNYKDSKIYKVISKRSGDDIMPPPPYPRLSDEQILTIARWIQDGALDTPCSSNNNNCNTSNVTLSNAVKPILDTYCKGCHSGTRPSGGINLTTYTGIRATALDGSLLGTIRHDNGYAPMPPSGTRLTTCQVSIISQWIAQGAKND